MSATREQAEFVFTEWHRLVGARDGAALATIECDLTAHPHGGR